VIVVFLVIVVVGVGSLLTSTPNPQYVVVEVHHPGRGLGCLPIVSVVLLVLLILALLAGGG